MAEEKTKKSSDEDKKSTKQTGKLIGIAVAAITVIGAGVFACLHFFGQKAPNDPTASPTYSKSFFISDGGKYTLWNDEGKRVTEETYTNKSDFIGGYALVRSDDKYSIIKEDGKPAVEYGKYGEIVAKGGLYRAKDGNTNRYYLITGTGKVLAEADKMELTASVTSAGFAVAEFDNTVAAFYYDGTPIVKLNKVDGGEVKMSALKDYGIVYYDAHNYVFDTRSKKTVAVVDDLFFKLSEVSEKRDQILLKDDENDKNYKLLSGGKIYDLNEMKYYSFTTLDYLIGYDSFSEIALLDENFKAATKVSSSVAPKDYKNYATEDENGNIIIVKNGETIKTFDKDADVASGVLYDDYYVIENDGKFGIYDLNGNQKFGDFKDIYSLFDRYHHIAVAKDEEDKYGLMDVNGNFLTGTDTYYRILTSKGGYTFVNSDKKRALADTSGHIATEFKYSDASYRGGSALDRNIWTAKVDTDKYDVINLDTKQILASDVNVYSISDNYFSVKNADKKIEYYTYSGVKFYTSEN